MFDVRDFIKPSRTCYGRILTIVGKLNNDKVDKRYQNKLPGDSSESMPLDCHLFRDIREGLARNIALSLYMKKDTSKKYDSSTPSKI